MRPGLLGAPNMPTGLSFNLPPSLPPAPAAPAASPMTGLLGANPAQARAHAFLKGIGAMAPGLLMAGAPSTDPGAMARGHALAAQGFQQGRQGALDRVRAENLQNINLQMLQKKAEQEQATYKAAAAQRQRLQAFAETAATKAEADGNPELAAMIRANPTEHIKNIHAKSLEGVRGKVKDRYLSIPNLGVADLGTGIVYTAQGPFKMGPKAAATTAAPVAPEQAPTTSSVVAQRPSVTDPQPLSPKATEELAVKEITRTKEPTEAEKKVDEVFAKDYNENIGQGGLADVEKQIAQLAAVKKQLETTPGLTGPLIGLIPQSVRPYIVPEAAAAQEAVEEVVQRNLRLILGAQFTAEEGRRLIARAYNPALDQAENAKRLGRLLNSMTNAVRQKVAAYKYYEKNRTLRGYKGASSFDVDKILAAAQLDDSVEPDTKPLITIRKKQVNPSLSVSNNQSVAPTPMTPMVTANGKVETVPVIQRSSVVPEGVGSSIDVAIQRLRPGTAATVSFEGLLTDVKDTDTVAGLQKVADLLGGSRQHRVQLLAYAGGDDLQTSKLRRVSLSRALAVRSALIDMGVEDTQIDVRAFGDKTRDANKNRVDINIIPR